jgi:peptidoglycan/xylan/chitin deacetylase (PgdA/CDA1 family)
MSVKTPASKRFLKRWSRRLVAGCGRLTHPGRRAGHAGGLRILTYHRIASDREDPFAVSPEEFRLQMDLLARGGAVAGLDQAIDHEGIGQGSAGGRGRVVLTFDDGTADFMEAALPVLKERSLPAMLYVIPSKVGTPGFVSWSDLEGLPAQGIRIGSHSLDHLSLGRLPREEVRRQVAVSRSILEQRLGIKVDSLAYPFGTLRDFGETVKEEARAAGYRTACTSINGVNGSARDLFELRRTKIEQGDGPIFGWILGGCLDGWALIDRYLSALQNRYA